MHPASKTTMRHRQLARLGLACLLSGAAASPALALTPAEIFAKVSPSVWRIRAYDKEGLPMSQGSAVVIAPETLVTNCHVLRKAARLSVVRDNVTMGATLDLWDIPRDVCQVKVRNLTAPAVAMGDMSRLAVGQNVYALGSPQGLELTLSAGLLSSLRRDDAQRLVMIQTSAPISPGSSGGGLFDDEGRLIGLTTMMAAGTNAQNLNFALPADWIRELPQRYREAHPPGGAASASASAPSPATVAATGAAPPAPPPAPPSPAAPATTSRAGKVPFLSDDKQERYQQYLGAPGPKAFAISENGHYARAFGNQPKDTSMPADPKERVLQICARSAGRPCVLYAVDNEVVYRP